MTTNTGILASGTTFSTQQLAVLLCAVSYSTDPQTDIQTYLPGWSIVWNGTETSDGNYAFIALDPTSTIYALGIRGSLPPFDVFKDWDAFANWILEDMDVVTRVSWPYVTNTSSNALIASGTNRAFGQVQNMKDSLGSEKTILEYLQANGAVAGNQVIITGHSLGGNVANVYASYFISQLATASSTFTNTALVTFAAPAAGNSDFATDLDAKLPNAWHYENDNDIVPKFPVSLSVLLVGFLYIGGPSASEITCTYKGKTVSLRDAFMLLAGIFAVYDYQAQSLNPEPFMTPTDSAYTQNTLSDFFNQAGYQHEVVHYATNLNVNLPQALVEQSRLV